MGATMAKQKRRQSGSPQQRPQVNAEADPSKVAEVEQGLAELEDLPDDVVEETPEAEPPRADITATQLRNLWNDVKRRDAQVAVLRERLSAQEKDLKEKEVEVRGRADELDLRESLLAEEEKELEAKRLAAKAGFIGELRASTKEIAEKFDAMLDDAATWGAEAKERAFKAAVSEQERLTTERAELDEQRESLRRREVEIRALEDQVRSDADFLKAKEATLGDLVQRRVEAELAVVRDEIEDLKRQLAAETERVAHKARDINDLRRKLASFGDDPEGQQRRIEALTEKLRAKEDELARRPAEAEITDLRQKAQRVAEAESDSNHWRSRHDLVDSQLRRYLVNVGELEVLRDERDALASQRETLRQAISQQKSDWDELQAKENSSRPFPACSDYDDDPTLARDLAGRDFDTLADLADEIRDRMATNPETSFYYSESDVRIFLAGLAASRLHLLQGISGTGKTSLPREFFKALAGDSAVEIVEVQAGWRDKDDLFGYYNAFEKRFAESEFTKALYRALLPANADRPMVIVLDEMNLAHPEQYFSVMLSLLENSATERVRIPLLTSAIPNLPAMFNGSELPLPRNVWFVGTANHDETTVAFADKTHDRAHVQTLPSNYIPFQPRNRGKADPVSFEALERAFATASKDYARDVDKVKNFLRSNMHGEFEEFGVGWGNRLERQIDRFVPVVLDSGGGITEAVDHLVATKLVRKLEDRFGIRPEQLERLADNIEIHWDELEKSVSPDKTLAGLRGEAKKLRGGFGS